MLSSLLTYNRCVQAETVPTGASYEDQVEHPAMQPVELMHRTHHVSVT